MVIILIYVYIYQMIMFYTLNQHKVYVEYIFIELGKNMFFITSFSA